MECECDFPKAPFFGYCDTFDNRRWVGYACGMDWLKMVADGVPAEVACSFGGMPRRVFDSRMKAGELDIECGATDTPEAILWKSVMDAKAEFVLKCTSVAVEAMQEGMDWKAAMKLLEKFMPSEYGDKAGIAEEVEAIQVIEGDAIAITHAELPEPDVEALAQAQAILPSKS